MKTALYGDVAEPLELDPSEQSNLSIIFFLKLDLFHQHFNNIPSTFHQHSFNISSTFKQHSNNISTTFQRHSLNIWFGDYSSRWYLSIYLKLFKYSNLDCTALTHLCVSVALYILALYSIHFSTIQYTF